MQPGSIVQQLGDSHRLVAGLRGYLFSYCLFRIIRPVEDPGVTLDGQQLSIWRQVHRTIPQQAEVAGGSKIS